LAAFTSDTYKLGELVNPTWLTLMTYVVTTGIALRNACIRGQIVSARAGHCAAAIVCAHVANGPRSRSS
ncbi:MAG TPA: hypothetical protein VFV33_20800, partial [Gemmatimonadaceae bacterium]|nr:hypothetical protein [Gemmatimonadaceae bacterium]